MLLSEVLTIFGVCGMILVRTVLSAGSCKDAGMCCPGRDSSCVVQKAPINAIIEDLSDQPCYCDHACLKLGDCCLDFKPSCGVADCAVSDWGDWSDCDSPCGTGSMVRNRTVVQQPSPGGTPCPELTQRRGCLGSHCPDHHRKAFKETAMVLPSTFSHIRGRNATSYDVRKNLRLRYPKDPAKENSKEYCVQFEVTKSSKACHLNYASKKLTQAELVCVRCEDAAMRRHLGYRCEGHGDDRAPTRYLSMTNPHCHGRWLRKEVSEECPCESGADFIFV